MRQRLAGADRRSATRLTFLRGVVPYIRCADYAKGCDMAELRGDGWPKNQHNNLHNKDGRTSMGSWSDYLIEETGPRNPIELHGAAYIAFCKAWAPQWIEDEEAESD